MGICVCKQKDEPNALRASITQVRMNDYSDQIEVITEFWENSLEKLSEKQYEKFVVQFYSSALNAIPDAKPLFNQAKRPIIKLGKTVFGMFSWIVSELKNQQNSKKFVKNLRILGKIHGKIGVKHEWYDGLLNIFNQSLSDKFPGLYTFRVQFCFTQLYNMVKDTMLNKDFYSIKHTAHMSTSLTNLQNCITNPNTLTYLQKYMQAHFCSELILFLEDCMIFKDLYDTYEQCDSVTKKAKSISETYVKRYSAKEINISHYVRERVIDKINENSISETVFDECMTEVEKMITDNIWIKFQKEFNSLIDSDLSSYDIKVGKYTREISVGSRIVGLDRILAESEYIQEYLLTRKLGDNGSE